MYSLKTTLTDAVLSFCRCHAQVPCFHHGQLEQWVIDRVRHVAPGSAGRVLRKLRLEKKVEYQVLSRSSALYKIVSIT